MLTFPVIYTAIAIIIMMIVLAKEVFTPAIVVFSTLLILVLGKVITIEEAFIGFSNHGMLTVGFLFIVSTAIKSSGIVEKAINQLLGRKQTNEIFRYSRLMFPVAFFSAFLNNTPIVATLIHLIKKWSNKTKFPSSKLLIPLSYAAILGGMCTLIGTSTNLVIHGLLISNGYDGFSFFELTKVGFPTAIIGILFIVFIGRFLLPRKRETLKSMGKKKQEFVTAVKVNFKFPHIGKSIEDAGLRHLESLYLFQIDRGGKSIAPVSPEEKIQENDRLFFTGLPETIYDLAKQKGLTVLEDLDYHIGNHDSDKLKTFEAVISNVSPLIGKTVRESNFRDKYNAVILAIQRSGHRINKKVGDITFHLGDTLFILADNNFNKRWSQINSFSLISSNLNTYSKPKWKSNLALVFLILMVILAALEIIPILITAACAAVLMILFNIISLNDAKNSIDWSVLLIIASSFGIGKAISNSGLAQVVASNIIIPMEVLGPIGIIAGLFILTSLLTWVITNNAVAALMFPVAIFIAQTTHIAIEPILITLALASSSSFATPIGYQTNLMVYSACDYKIKDFMKIGIPMNIIIGIVVTVLVYLFYF